MLSILWFLFLNTLFNELGHLQNSVYGELAFSSNTSGLYGHFFIAWSMANSLIFCLLTYDLTTLFWLARSTSEELSTSSFRAWVILDHPNWWTTLDGEYLSTTWTPQEVRDFYLHHKSLPSICKRLGFQHNWSGYKFSKHELQSSWLLKRFYDNLLRLAWIRSS